jgi:hypothetical protein
MRRDVWKVKRNSKLTLLDYTECPAERGTLHSNRRRRQLYITRSRESRVIAGLHAVERTTSTVAEELTTVPRSLAFSSLFKYSLRKPSRDNGAQGAAIQTTLQLRPA